MTKWIDFYKVLQVHSSAEYEVIESAYKRLCRKYHPDQNKSTGAVEKMIQLNLAYEVLRDKYKRKAFHEAWILRNATNKSFNEEGCLVSKEYLSVLENYFHYISNEAYAEAFQLISEHDKARFTVLEFMRWQTAVSKVFRIVSFECCSLKSFKNVMIGDSEFDEVIECNVVLQEKNLRNNTTMQDEVTKYLVKEGCFWNVFVGFSELQPLIDKFETLAESKLFPSAMEYWAHLQIRTDHVTGLPNKEGFLEKAHLETSRCRRYGNSMSILFLKLKPAGLPTGLSKKDYWETMQRMYATSIQQKIRDTDILGVWELGEFIILLPEIKLQDAQDAAQKFGANRLYQDVPAAYRSSIFVGVSEYHCKSLTRVISEARLKALLGYRLNHRQFDLCDFEPDKPRKIFKLN